MIRSTTEKKSQTLGVALVLLAVFITSLFSSFAFGASRAQAQVRQQTFPNPPALNIANPRAPQAPTPPFGYGGGPRTPRSPDVTSRLAPIFQQILAFLRALFG